MATKTVSFEIKRQASPDASAVWESFEVEWRPGMNVISAMMEIATNPVTADGRATTPVTYDSNCLEEICGSCAMRINGRARMACSSLVDNLEQPIKVEPLSKFPLVRDLQVDRSVLFENLKAVKAWIPIDGTYDLGSGPRILTGSSRGPSRGLFLAYVSECLMGGHGFYDDVFESLDIPYEPVRWQKDVNASDDEGDGTTSG